MVGSRRRGNGLSLTVIAAIMDVPATYVPEVRDRYGSASGRGAETKEEGERSGRRVSRRARVDGRNEICTKKGGGGREEKRLGNPGSIVVAVECT